MKNIHKLVITDLDGTLLKGDDIVPQSFLNLMHEMQAHGVRFAIASGRQYGIIKELFKDYYRNLLLIGDNGAAVYEGEQLIYKNPLAHDLIYKYREVIRKYPQLGLLYAGIKTSYCESANPILLSNQKRFCHYPTSYKNLEDMLENDEIGKMAIYNFDEGAANNVQLFAEYFDEADFVVSGKNWIDITTKHTSKGQALNFIKDHYHYQSEDVIAFGDYNNDISMFKEAKYSYAMANANQEVKNCAYDVCLSNLEDGVTKKLEELFRAYIEHDLC